MLTQIHKTVEIMPLESFSSLIWMNWRLGKAGTIDNDDTQNFDCLWNSIQILIYQGFTSPCKPSRVLIQIFRNFIAIKSKLFLNPNLFWAEEWFRLKGSSNSNVSVFVTTYTFFFISNPNFDRLSLRFSKIRATWSATAEPQIENS